MNDTDAFLATIWANPRDITPRFIFADWLEEHGEAEYAQFIRLSGEIELREPAIPEYRRRMRLERFQLGRRLAERWANLIPGIDPHEIVTVEGMPLQYVTLETTGFLSWNGSWPVFLPTRLGLRNFEGQEYNIAAYPHLARISHLHFASLLNPPSPRPPFPPSSDKLLRALCASVHTHALRELRIDSITPSRKGFDEFARSALVKQLRRFAFDFPTDLINHDWADIEAVQPPAGAISEVIQRFLDEYAEQLPVE